METIRRAAAVASVIGVAIGIVWFFTPLPTIAARYAWERFAAGSLALMLDRTDADLAYSIGVYYFGNQPKIGIVSIRPYDTALANRAFTRAIRIDPSLPLAHYMRSRLEFVYGQFDASIADLNDTLALNPDNKRPLYMRGLAYAYRGHAGDLALAEQDFRTFSAWAPTEWAGYNDLAYVIAKEGNYAAAEIILKEGIQKAKGGATNPWLWDALGVMEMSQHKYDAAIASLQNAQEFAQKLTETDWQLAYPGNDPALAKAGVQAIQDGIVRNLAKAYAAAPN
jgi:lipoprotein NlpI